MKEALVELFQERRDLFRDLFREVLEESDLAEDKEFEDVVAREIAAFHELHPLLQQYPGEFVAIQDQTV